MNVLMVCLGNICRSPMAEGILQHLATGAGLNWNVDSAGTGRWHVGEAPDRRAVRTCDKNGINISAQRARQFRQNDFQDFDMILTMDNSNLDDVVRLARNDYERSKIYSIMDFTPVKGDTVPDPYFDGHFDEAFELLWESCSAIVRREQ
jgi:low molecular weight protein-tyrosine phosphatase